MSSIAGAEAGPSRNPGQQGDRKTGTNGGNMVMVGFLGPATGLVGVGRVKARGGSRVLIRNPQVM